MRRLRPCGRDVIKPRQLATRRPMAVDQDTVRRIARLARIRIADEDVPVYEAELNQILHWIEQLNAVDVAGVEPLTSVV
ncbi:MAG: Asp-tRNA(Asn)/Glu-tRNA(Gln) amidotransferase subunit GatC, partial [Roseovarius sp.]